MARILLAEDEDMLRTMTKTILELDGHTVFAYINGQQAYEAFSEINPDLVVSDIGMPILDGFGLLDAVRQLPNGAVVPFLFLSAFSEREDVRQARNLGADDYLFKPYEASELLEAVRTRLERRRISTLFDTRDAHLQTIILLANVIEARDAYTRGHVERVQQLAMEFGQALGWPSEDLTTLEYGALLHDVGKITIPETILNKPGALTPEEHDIMRCHTTACAKILEGVPHLQGAKPYILYHHEKWNGTGYPEGLKGDQIPREGRLMAFVDVYDALITDRPYHRGKAPEDVLEIIRRGIGIHFDPDMAQVFLKLRGG
jgi:putative two-component system response regulator